MTSIRCSDSRGPHYLDVLKTGNTQEVDRVILVRVLHLSGHGNSSEGEVGETERGEGVVFQHRGQGVVGFIVVRELREFDVEESERSKHRKRQEDGIEVLRADAGVAEDE